METFLNDLIDSIFLHLEELNLSSCLFNDVTKCENEIKISQADGKFGPVHQYVISKRLDFWNCLDGVSKLHRIPFDATKIEVKGSQP